MLESFYPDEYLDSAYVIDYKKLSEEGYRGVLFDIDNTLVPHGAPADERAVAFFEMLRKMGFSTCLISNNKKSSVHKLQLPVFCQLFPHTCLSAPHKTDQYDVVNFFFSFFL